MIRWYSIFIDLLDIKGAWPNSKKTAPAYAKIRHIVSKFDSPNSYSVLDIDGQC